MLTSSQQTCCRLSPACAKHRRMMRSMLRACVAIAMIAAPGCNPGQTDRRFVGGGGDDDVGGGDAGIGTVKVTLPQAVSGAMFANPDAFPTIPVHIVIDN